MMTQADFSSINAARHNHSSLSIHPYFGKVDPSIVSTALTSYSQSYQTVLDPFCGSGTVIHGALLAKRNVVGFDSSPLACMIAAAKVLGISKKEEQTVTSWVSSIIESGDIFDKNIQIENIYELDVPRMPRVRSIDDWFGQKTLLELSRIKKSLLQFENNESAEAGLLARVIFSRIITQASYQKGESTYSRVKKEDSAARIRGLLLNSARAVIRSTKAFNDDLAKNGFPPPATNRLNISKSIKLISHGENQAIIINGDSRNSKDFSKSISPVDLVVTSPPYLMSWDYGLYHKFRFYWLGFDLDDYEDSEIGRHLRRRDDDVERYTSDMTDVFESIMKLAKPGAHAVFVNAASVVYGKLVDTNKLLASCADTAGWQLLSSTDSVDIPGPHHGMYASLDARSAIAPGRAGKKEHVLVFKNMLNEQSLLGSGGN